jgi:quercetin dioxygenase-like cupin family protein
VTEPDRTDQDGTDVTDGTDGDGPARRRGIRFFDKDEARPLHETGMMSMPTTEGEVDDQLMEWALSGGHIVNVLYQDGDGMSLVWSWFGPGYTLPRHSHSADCLYFVVSGQARLGNRTVEAGSGFFVPANAPYAYSAGPEGIQILEFRTVGSFDMRITESLGGWDQIVETVRQHGDEWKAAAVDV